MNEKSDKPEEKKKQLREISDEELRTILAEHKKWLDSDGKEGQRADLAKTDLRGKNLFEADLQRASLIGSDLSKAGLGGANFQEAILILTDFRKAKIFGTNFQAAALIEANFEETIIFKSNLEESNLEKANLHKATMIDIKGLHTANLQDCNLEGATGLKGTEFARADITGAKLPEDIRDFKILKIVEETSKNARKIFLAMLLGCVYSWLTIATTTDVNLLTNSSSSPLPIIRTPIPIAWFYLTAPILLVGFYLYLHFYLHRLWEGLAGLPARFEDGKRLDERAYPWLLNGLVRRHFDKIKKKRSLIARLEEWVSIILAWWVVPFTMCCFWLRYIPRHEWTGTILHITLIIVSIAASIIFYRSHAKTLRGDKPREYQLKKAWRDRRTYQLMGVVLAAIVLILLSHGSINGLRLNWGEDISDVGIFNLNKRVPWLFNKFGFYVYADFYEKDVSTKPDNYWLIDPAYRDSSVTGANLFEADLRQANVKKAFMAKADLRNAKLQGAVLLEANLKRAYLRQARLEGADLSQANLEGADLSLANLDGADLTGARLEGADLMGAWFEGAVLLDAKLEGANLQSANLKGAELYNATGLTQEQLDEACGDSLTILPRGLTIPHCPEWPSMH